MARARSARTQGRHQVGGLIHQIAGEVLRFRQDYSALERLVRVPRHWRRRPGETPPGTWRRSMVCMLVRLEVSEHRAFNGGGRDLPSCQPPSQRLHTLLLERSHRGAGGFAQRGRVECRSLPAAHRRQTLRGHALRLMEHGQFARFAGELAGGSQFVEPGRDELNSARRASHLQTAPQRRRRLRRDRAVDREVWISMILIPILFYSLRRPSAARASAFISRSRSLSRLS